MHPVRAVDRLRSTAVVRGLVRIQRAPKVCATASYYRTETLQRPRFERGFRALRGAISLVGNDGQAEFRWVPSRRRPKPAQESSEHAGRLVV